MALLRPRIGLIWAQDENGSIGKGGGMPWHVPEDLAHFKCITLGSPVVMGRKTWDSLPARFRPLPDRCNIVITRQQTWATAGVDVVHSVDAALEVAVSKLRSVAAGDADGLVPSAVHDDFIWVLGGAEIFSSVIDHADRLEVTQIRARFEGDTVAPTIDSRWRLVAEDPPPTAPAETEKRVAATDSAGPWHTSRSGLGYRFLRYQVR